MESKRAELSRWWQLFDLPVESLPGVACISQMGLSECGRALRATIGSGLATAFLLVVMSPALALAAYTGQLGSDPEATIEFSIQRGNHGPTRAAVTARGFRMTCTSGNYGRHTITGSKFRFISESVFYGAKHSFDDTFGIDTSRWETKGRLLDDGSARGHLQYSFSHRIPPTATENTEHCTTGKLRWTAEKSR